MIRIENVTKTFEVKDIFGQTRSQVTALDNINLRIREGESLGLVGESGSGKSTLGEILLGLEEPSSGSIYYRDELIDQKKRQRIQRKKWFQTMFQSPYDAMNPNLSALSIVAEPLMLLYSTRQSRKIAKQILLEVGLSGRDLRKRPPEFSVGELQRIIIARAIAVDPKLLVCDEPLSALDVSVQAQIINLLMNIRADKELTMLFISHDLAMVRSLSQRIAVMYLGHIVELADTEEIFANPQHAYTKKLLAAIPIPDPKEARQRQLHLKPNSGPIAIGRHWQQVSDNHWVMAD